MLCGGAGTRFWPVSREANPKPFLKLLGNQSLLDVTLDRLQFFAAPERTWVVTSGRLETLARRALKDRKVQLLIEPEARNTAPAIALAAAHVASVDPAALVGVFPADHHIGSRRAFEAALATAARAARRTDSLALVGIEPRDASTAYGYLKLGGSVARGAFHVECFVEKPKVGQARGLIRGGALWNAGIVVGTAERILSETKSCAPEIWRGLGSALESIRARRRVTAIRLKRAYVGLTPKAFDHAVLERSRRVAAVRGRFRWSDLGSWDALALQFPGQVQAALGKGGPVISVDSRDNFVWNATDKTMAVIGLEGLVVVNTGDALLVCPQERAQDVRYVVAELRRLGRKELI